MTDSRCLVTLKGDTHCSNVFGLGKTSFVSTNYEKLDFWDTSSNSESPVRTLNLGHIKDVDVSNGTVIVASKDLKLYNASTGNLIRSFTQPNGQVTTSVVFVDGGRKILSLQKDEESQSSVSLVKLWDVATGRCLRRFTTDEIDDVVLSLVPVDDERFLVHDVNSLLKLLSVSGESVTSIEELARGVFAICLVDADRFLSSNADGRIELRNISSGRCIKTYQGHRAFVFSLAKVGNEGFLSASFDTTVKLWNHGTGECIRTFKGHHGAVFSVSLVDDCTFVSSSFDCTLKLWAITRWPVLKPLLLTRQLVSLGRPQRSPVMERMTREQLVIQTLLSDVPDDIVRIVLSFLVD